MVQVCEHHGRDETNDAFWSGQILLLLLTTVLITHKLLIQVHEVVIDTPVDRVDKLKISLGKTHPELLATAWQVGLARLTDRSPTVTEVYIVDVDKG